MSVNKQINVYSAGRILKQHEERLKEKIMISFKDFSAPLKVLDIGCADGKFLNEIQSIYQNAKLIGFDYSETLVNQGLNEYPDLDLFVGDASVHHDIGKFDIIIASGVLSIFDEPEKILKLWTDYLKENGKLFIFGRFNTADIDTIIKFRVGDRASEWEGGWSSYSKKSILEILDYIGYTAKFEKFHFDGKLDKTDNPVKTYTMVSDQGERFMITGGNVIAEQFFCEVEKIN